MGSSTDQPPVPALDKASEHEAATSRQASARPETMQVEFRNPLSELPATARNLILAAKAIIADEGFEALSLNRLALAAGENKSMIAYYFGNKAGLVAAVLDSVIHDEYLASEVRMENVDPAEVAPRLLAEMREINSSTRDFHVFFELLPHVLRDDVLRARLLPLYQWYWSMKFEWLGLRHDAGALDDPDLLGIARLLSAMIDGLAVQSMIEPGADLSGAYRVFGELVADSLPRFVAAHQAAVAHQ